MYIKSIELDGFKSYARRTEVRDFDRLFNAITGLNGSGKSNILDSICFLLGISQLSHVRATNLNELVYKNGQAGITRATVSITFDNTDKSNSPMGYNNYDEVTVTRQINIGGRNKYLINGVNAQNMRVTDFFQSVGLNINNPHFLIMQGRVTKVMNMKPMEILSMIEEATGTRMYETKREHANKQIEKKTLKWKEMTDILTQELEPKIAKLKEDRESYLAYQQISREIEQNEKIVVAFKFMTLDQKLAGADAEKAKLDEALEKANENKTNLETKLNDVVQQIEQMQNQNETEKGEKLGELDKELESLRSDEAKKISGKKKEQEKLRQQQKRIGTLKKQIKANQDQMQKKQSAREEMSNSHETNTNAAQTAEDEFEKAKMTLEQLRLGAAFGDGGAKTMADEAIEKRQLVSEKETEIKKHSTRTKAITNELRQLKQKASKASSSYTSDIKQKENIARQLEKVNSDLAQIDFNEEETTVLAEKVDRMEGEDRNYSDQEQNFYNHFPQLEDPVKYPRDFDRRKVKGLVANLIKVSKMDYVAAVEKAAGGKLYQLVVDSSDTAEYLLKNKLLKKRTTIIPLDNIRGHGPLDPRVIQKAKQLVGGQNADSAKNCVEMAPEFDAVRDYCFNGVLVAKTNDQAHALCYNRDIMTKVISAEGDVFDPSGVISGGASSRSHILKEIAQLRKIQSRRNEIHAELGQLKYRLSEMERNQSQFFQLDKQRNLMSNKLQQIDDRLQQSEFGRQQADIERLEAELVELNEALAKAKELHAIALKDAKDIEDRIENLAKNRDAELKRLEKEVNQKQKVFDAAVQRVEAMSTKYEGLAMELEALKSDAATAEAELEAEQGKSETYSQEVEQQIKLCDEAAEKIQNVKDQIKQQRDLIAARDNEILEQKSVEKETQKQIKIAERGIDEAQTHIRRQMEQNSEEDSLRRKMIEENDWIEQDRHMFGVKNTPYDFEFRDPRKAEQALRKGLAQKDKLTGQINQRAMALLTQAEKQYQELIVKRQNVEEDLEKITQSIKALDEKKKSEITSAYKEVNKNFESIFSNLLPGATAKLAPTEGKTVLEGLEFKVGFGNVWKDNLSELSGGQRSLVALSLILAMLLLKPAPIYILDEVDAALDLSHTQNIGSMLKHHFKKSQFIVVSLKDGMYENASVLYRTKFVDGVSTVTRIAAKAPAKGRKDVDKENRPNRLQS